MCGIAGKFNFNDTPVNKTDILNMVKAISHRGPDSRGIHLDGSVGLGHARLSIIDLSAKGGQPMCDASKRFWIVYNGEAYNFKNLRAYFEKNGARFRSESDTEVVLELYKKYGTDCLRYLRGMFALAIYDSLEKSLFLARDRVGKKPLKYYADGKTFIFASELKSILQNPEVKKKIDWEAISEFLTYKYVPAPRTGFLNIRKLKPGHFMTIDSSGEIRIEKYWEPDFSRKEELSEDAWQGKITDKLKEAVSLRLTSDVPLGAHLSGGIDSSLVVALMAEASAERIKTFSIGFSEARYNELGYARLLAGRYKTEHREMIVRPGSLEQLDEISYFYEEPYADASLLPTWHLCRLTREHVTVALNGDGGDEAFGGYERYRAPFIFHQLKRIPAKRLLAAMAKTAYSLNKKDAFWKAYRALNSDFSSLDSFYLSLIRYFSEKDKRKLMPNIGNFSAQSGSDLVVQFPISNFPAQGGSASGGQFPISNFDRLFATGLLTHLPDDLLVKTDIASMAHGLELRSPFLDQEFLELSMSMPADLKIRGQEKKYILKRIAYQYLPKECIDRPKQGFSVPLEYWFKSDLNDFLKRGILDKKFLDFGFNETFIQKLLLRHSQGRERNENQLFTLLMLSLWLRRWFN